MSWPREACCEGRHAVAQPVEAAAPERDTHRGDHPEIGGDPREEHQQTIETRKESYRQGHLLRAEPETREHRTQLMEPEQTEEAESTEEPLEVLTGR